MQCTSLFTLDVLVIVLKINWKLLGCSCRSSYENFATQYAASAGFVTEDMRSPEDVLGMHTISESQKRVRGTVKQQQQTEHTN